MESLYQYVCKRVFDGARFSVDFKKRNLKINGEYIVENGETSFDTGEYIEEIFLSNVEGLYKEYKQSIPSERSESKGKRYFMAVSEHELSDDDMLYGVSREIAQSQLETYILCCILSGAKWNEKWGKWFWQSPNDRDLILLREWFE